MAEERIIDDDLNKDKKYRIRKNADGEDELYIDESAEEEYEDVSFDIPEFLEDDDTAVDLTPEQYAAREAERRQEEERKIKSVEQHINEANERLAAGDYEAALAALNLAEELQPQSGTVLSLKLLALTRNFTDFTRAEEAAETAEGVKHFCTEGRKKELFALSSGLSERIKALEDQTSAMGAEVEAKKSERSQVFLKDKRKASIFFAATLIPFIITLVAAVSFGTVITARRDGIYLILTIAFAAVALICFVALMFAVNKLWSALKKLSLNRDNSSTKLGREYEAKLAELSNLKSIFQSVNG